MRTVLNIILIAVFIILTAGFNFEVIDIRISELNYLLGKIAAKEENSQSIGIIGKYELIKKRMEQGEENSDAYELEARVASITSSEQTKPKELSTRKKLIRAPVNLMINAMRLALGKPILNTKEDSKLFKLIEIGYFWERIRKYQEAIKIYDEVLAKPDYSADVRSVVMIHKAFCHSMLGEYSASKVVYERVIDAYPNSDAGILSWKLLDFIESMEKQRVMVEQQVGNSFEKARQFYMVMDYRNAIKNFSVFLGGNPSPEMVAQASYYKGRCFEELGESQEAMNDYYKVIRTDQSQVWGKQANRRMLMLGEFYEQKKQISEEARRQLASYQDSSFIKKMNNYSQLVSESSLRKELMNDAAVAKSKAGASGAQSSDSLMSLINSIGELDLSGEKTKKKQMEELKAQLISDGKLTQADMGKLEQQVAIASNPFRRPTAIKEVIDNNTSQLRYIYNKSLREGVKISGKMLVEIKIGSNGAVAGSSVVNSNIGDARFEKDILAQIQTWKFKQIDEKLGLFTVKYPFEFFEEE